MINWNLLIWKNAFIMHNCDVELRRRTLQLVALKLLYSHRTIPELGYERAKNFIDEFNSHLGLNLSSDEIKKVINRDYKADKIKVNQNEGKSLKKIRNFINKILKDK